MAELFFGDFNFDTKNLRLEGPHGEVEVRAKTLQLLTYLVEHRNRFVSRDELMRELWKDVRVTKASVTQCISELRQHLGDSAKDPVYVETRVKYGYRFIAPLYYRPTEKLEPLPPPPEPSSTAQAAVEVRRKTLVGLGVVVAIIGVVVGWWLVSPRSSGPPVLVLAHFSTEGNEHLVGPVAALIFETLEKQAQSWNGVLVTSDREAARTGHNAWVLEGSVAERHGRRLKVWVDLVQASSGTRSWGWSSLVPADEGVDAEVLGDLVREVELAVAEIPQS